MTDIQERKPQTEQPVQPTARNVMKQAAVAVAVFVVVAAVVATAMVRSTEPDGRSEAAIAAESARLTGLANWQPPTESLESVDRSQDQVQSSTDARAIGETFTAWNQQGGVIEGLDMGETFTGNRSPRTVWNGPGGVIEGTEMGETFNSNEPTGSESNSQGGVIEGTE